VAVTARPKLDAQKQRADFPIFNELIHGKPLSFLDSAASSQKPRQVLDAMQHFYETSYANVHRGVYELAERATAGYEGARETVGRFLNAPSPREVVFTRNATEGDQRRRLRVGLNNLGPGDVVLVTELEHHSNFVPWQYIAHRTGADFRMLPLDDEGELRLDALDEVAGAGRVKVVAAGMVSNSLGSVNPVEKLAAWAHERGAIMVCDAAQGAPHRVVDVQALGADFVAVTAHKLCGPSGIGALWGRMELLEAMEPFNLGGHMISRVTVEDTSWGEVPAKFEAGTQAIAEAVGLRRRDRLHHRDRPRRDRAARARAGRLRARAPCRAALGQDVRAARRSAGPGSSPSTSTASTRTTWPRSWMAKAWRSAPATTAASR
jgi:cysteine desulfurase/selenocysteine lyase